MNPKPATNLLIVLFCVLAFNCRAQKDNRFMEEGEASFYSNAFVGRKTASGEIFSQDRFIAAHRSLPFGTWIKVVNLQNKRSVIVQISDRGPFIKERIIDLSKSAAKQIGGLNEGIYRVQISIYKKDKHYIKPKRFVIPIHNESLSSSMH